MIQQIDLYKFQAKQAHILEVVGPSKWHPRTRLRKAHKIVTTTKINARCILFLHLSFKQDSKDLPWSTEWTDVCTNKYCLYEIYSSK